MFLNVEQQVAAGAGAEKIPPLCYLRQRRIAAKAREVLPELPNFRRRWAIAALGNQSPCSNEVLSRTACRLLSNNNTRKTPSPV